MLHVDHSRQAQSPGSSLPGTRVAAHGKRAAYLLARFLLTAQGAGASGLFSQPRVRHGVTAPRSSLIRVYTVCHSVCIVWTHYSTVGSHSSNFRVITTNCLGVRIFRKFTVYCFVGTSYWTEIVWCRNVWLQQI